jgi:hypothetical protein
MRVYVPFHARVSGTDSMGSKFSIETVLDNMSAHGLYLRMMPDVETGAKLAIDVGLHPASRIAEDEPRVSVDGVVVRKDRKAGGAAGLAVSFLKVSFP